MNGVRMIMGGIFYIRKMERKDIRSLNYIK
jgi:hypothetical protein